MFSTGRQATKGVEPELGMEGKITMATKTAAATKAAATQTLKGSLPKAAATKAAATKVAGPFTGPSENWMRGCILIHALLNGWKHSQTGTYVDVFTKAGYEPVILHWGTSKQGHLTKIQQGATTLEKGQGSMLQRAQNMLAGKQVIGLSEKWKGVTAKVKTEANEFMAKMVKVVAPK